MIRGLYASQVSAPARGWTVVVEPATKPMVADWPWLPRSIGYEPKIQLGPFGESSQTRWTVPSMVMP